MKKIFVSLLICLTAMTMISCGGGHRRTTVIIVESDPVQTYKINIVRMSAVNPIGNIYVSVSNIYETISTDTTSVDIEITDKGDNRPITFSLKDAAGTIFSETLTLTDSEFLSSDEVTIQSGNDPDNFITFTFSIILETKKQ